MFSIGNNIEAVDEEGQWARGKVLEIKDEGWVVKFDNWSRKWNRVVGVNEIRERTAEERSSGRKRKVSLIKFVVSFFSEFFCGSFEVVPVTFTLHDQIIHLQSTRAIY